MSCPSEASLLLYTESELDGDALRELESHLVTCRHCRETVVALRDETRLLTDVLQERERAHSVAPVRARAPEPGIAIGLPAAIAAVTVALAVVGFLLETRVPGGMDHLNPLRLKGAYEMAFDLIFLARDRAPGALELAVPIGGLAAVSALLTFAVGAFYRRLYGATAALLLAFTFLAPEGAQALVMRIDEDTQVSSSEVIGESMLLSGDVVHVDGTIDGDLIVGAERVTIGGTVRGNVYAIARDFEVTGTIEGSLHGAIEHSRIDGVVEGSVYGMMESLTLAPSGRVGRDLTLVAEDGIVGGTVGRDVVFGGEELEIRSEVGRNVTVRWAEKVTLRDGARIQGDVLATLEAESDLERAPGAEVAGTLTFEERNDAHDYLAWYKDTEFWAFHALAVVAAFLFGLLLYLLVPSLFGGGLSTGPEFWRSLGQGFLVIVVTPIAVVALALTVVGIPVAVLLLFVYVVLFYSAEIVVGAWIGRMVWPPTDDSVFSFGRSFFVGLLILAAVSLIPFIGPPIAVVATLVGAGLLFAYGRERIEVLA